MYNSKLYSILEQFNKYEQNRCRKYIQSPYFNKSQDLIDLYEIFIKRLNSSSQKPFTKEVIWRKLNPKRPFDDVRFRKYCSDLLKMVENYLGQEEYEKDSISQAINTMKSIRQRKLERLHNNTVKKVRRSSEKHGIRNAEYFLQQYHIERELYSLNYFEAKRSDRSNIESISDNLDYFYFAEKLRLYYVGLIQGTFGTPQNYNFLFIEQVINQIQNSDNSKFPVAIRMYYQIILATREMDNEVHYYKMKELLEQFALDFPKEEAYALYNSAINYCILKINGGNNLFLDELFDLYNDQIKKEVFIINNELSPWKFKNIVVIALRLGKYEWTESFINTYKDKLPEASRENAVTYNLAQVYFYQKRYEKVIPLLHSVEYEDLAYNLGSKAMLIATYYETDEIEPLHSLFESFRTYLNRHKDIPANRRKNYTNLIKYTKKLTRIRPREQAALKKLKEEVENTKNIASINWLKEKISELE